MKKPIPFGKYYLLERINVGGMAEVFRAKAYGVEGFERLVAVKRILPNIAEDKEFIGMFIDEAKIAVQLNHANIAQIFDLGMVESSYYIALEHIHGRDLRAIYDRCREQGDPMPIAQAAFVIMKVCEGLDYAHNKRDQSGRNLDLVHRDVSPQNVLVSFEGEVKIIDFGIAKAAGKNAKTQAGILKGKFGYMSPEQVRGLPIDRRTDIFSCGIVLYELLTGERLFVGESDFSTLEKVRNVEILPPSTYNRKIPDELERIVLKALAKDVEDRYQNAIDLHDDLQAFVYTAGEFYSRKDLAAWMKDTFSKEIEEETAKLEAYRQMRPQEMRPPAAKRSLPPPNAPRRSTLAMPSVAPKPPPLPGSNGRRGAPSLPLPAAAAGAASFSASPRTARPQENDLAWDDDELETQIYDSPEDLKAGVSVSAKAAAEAASTLPLGSVGSGPGLQPPPVQGQPDLSSLSNTARGWDSGPQSQSAPPPPASFPSGSNQSPSPFPDDRDGSRSEAIGETATVSAFDTINPGDALVPLPQKRGGGKFIPLMAVLVLLIAGGAVGYFVLTGGSKSDALATTDEAATDNAADTKSDSQSAVATGPTDTTGGANPAAAQKLSKEVLAETGFDLIVDPKTARVELDGAELKMTPPMKVRNIAPGEHELVINGPAGFYSKNETITVAAGKAETVTVTLDPLEISASFNSEPPGAQVTLVVDKTQEVPIGSSPVRHKLDPRKSYEARFELKGYETRTESVGISGDSEERVVAVLTPAKSSGRKKSDRRIVRRNNKKKNDPIKKDTDSGGSDDTAKKGTGTLMLGSKPPCQIFIDGKNTGKKTPQRNLKLSAGRHRITLINNEYGIKESFSVSVKPGQTQKQIKNLTHLIK